MKEMSLAPRESKPQKPVEFQELCEKFVAEHPDCMTYGFTYLYMQANEWQKHEGIHMQYALDYVLRQLCRSNVKDFAALHLHCRYRQDGEWDIHRVGPAIRVMVCQFCQACKGPCPGPSAFKGTTIPVVTLDAAYDAGVIDRITYSALDVKYGSVEELYHQCMGHPSRIVKECPNLGTYGMNNACEVCKAYLEGNGLVCPRVVTTPVDKSVAISDVLVRNISNAFGVSIEDAERALRTGSLKA